MVERPNSSTQATSQRVPSQVSVKEIGSLKVYLNQRLGQGVTSQVYKGSYKKEPGQGQKKSVAVKVIQIGMVKEQNMQKFLNQEFAVLNRVRHRNIVEFLGFERTKNAFYFIFELCEGGNFQDYLRQRGALPEFEAQKFFKQIADAMITLNREEVMHRDLKPANILLTKENQIRLADFGLARPFKPNEEDGLLQTHVGTPYYKAPEIYHQQGYKDNVDLWSLGIMLFQMVAGDLPFKATSEVELFQKIRAGAFSLPLGIQISKVCADLIQRLIQEDPDRRLNYDQFRKHPFVQLEADAYRIYVEKLQLTINTSTSHVAANSAQSSSGLAASAGLAAEEAKQVQDLQQEALAISETQDTQISQPQALKQKPQPASVVISEPAGEDLFAKQAKDVQDTVSLTLKRAKALEQAYKTQFEDRAEMITSAETEVALQLLIFNLTRELKQIYIAIAFNEAYTTQVSADEHLSDISIADKWLVLDKIGTDLALLRNEEEVSRASRSADQIARTTAHQYLFLPDEAGNQVTNRLTLRFCTQRPQSTNSSGNEQFSESQQSSSEQPQQQTHSSSSYRSVPLTSQFLTQLRQWVNSGQGRVLFDELLELRKHFDCLASFISNLSIIADEQKESGEGSFAMNTTRLFLLGLQLHEQAQDAMKIFETRESIEQFEAALIIMKELLAEMQLSTLFQGAAEERKESACASGGESQQRNQEQIQAYTFLPQASMKQMPRFFKFDEGTASTFTEGTIRQIVRQTEKQLQTLKGGNLRSD